MLITERKWLPVAPILLTANGTTGGMLQIPDTSFIKVKMVINIFSDTIGPLNQVIEVKQVLNETQFLVGPQGGKLQDNYLDVSAYTVAENATIFTNIQDRPKISEYDSMRAVYDEEPTIALRNVLVDQYGNKINANNPLAVNANVTIPPVTATVDLDAFTKNPPDNAISVGTEDGTKTGTKHALQVDSELDLHVGITNGPNKANVNSNGSIDVNVVSGGSSNPTVNTYNTASAVATAVLTTVTSYTVPAGKTAVLEKIAASGNNLARYSIQINGTEIDSKSTYYSGGFNVDFDYISNGQGYEAVAGDVIRVQVYNNSQSLGTFNARIQVVELS